MPAATTDTTPRGEWWQAFGDTKLNELQSQLRDGSEDLRAAVARFEQARAIARGTRSNLFPTLGASASAGRSRTLRKRAGIARRRDGQ